MEKLRDLLEWTDGTEAFEGRMLDKVSEYKSIVIFGAGIGGKMTYELLTQYNEHDKCRAFSDNNKDKIGTKYLGLPVIMPQAIGELYPDSLVLVSSTAFDVISNQLQALGINKKNIYYFQPAGLSLNCSEDVSFIRSNIEKLEEVYELLEDEKSKLIYRCILNYRITKDNAWLDKLAGVIDKEESQYFDKEILEGYYFGDGFVDAGAYTGDTCINFFHYYPDWNGVYYCLEAEKDIYKQLCANVEKIKDKEIIPYQYAVWDSEGELRFDANGEGSRVSDEGNAVACVTIDKLLMGGGQTIGFIKMDIEGAEKRALLGSRNTIKQCAPVLAICIYHKPEDFFELPLLIKSMVGDEYRFFVRQYRYGQSEIVLYAMPKKRRK